MTRREKNSAGLVLLMIVILAAFFLVNPLFRFSVSRVVMHDWLGMNLETLQPGLFLGGSGMIRVLPLMLLFLLWSAVAVWVYHDAERRNLSGFLWSVFVFVGNVIGLIIYLILRSTTPTDRDREGPPVTTAACPSCGGGIYTSYVACPHCGHQLGARCGGCDRTLEPEWKACPYCGRSTGRAD